MTPLRALQVALLLCAAAACKPTWAIDLAESGTGTTPTFTLRRAGGSEPARISAFRVDACAARGMPPMDTHWLTLAPDTRGERSPISRIVYGESPAGWRSAQGPHPLLPGCYRAAVADAPPLEFDVLPDGRVTARH